MVFRGNVGEISRRQQSIKEKLLKLDCQLTANEGVGGGGVIILSWSLMRNQVNFVFLPLPLR